ncbi:hypothetical protein Q7P37_008437 [Cladosporium fusiforme]
MPPKRGTTRPTRGAKRGRGGDDRGGKNHARVLSDITEESLFMPQERLPQSVPTLSQRGKKRAFHEAISSEEIDNARAPTAGRETRAQAAKRMKQSHETNEPANVQEQRNEDYQPLVSRLTLVPLPYTPSPALLSFIQMYDLDTDHDTETIALNLIDLTLSDANWHTGLSGMIQPAACFLVASILTRRQNLVEDIAASVESFGVGYEDLIGGYGLLWQWRENTKEVLGACGEMLDELPDPSLFLEAVPEEVDDHAVDETLQGEDYDGRPEPERWE